MVQKAHDPNEVRTMAEWEEELQTMFVDFDPKQKISRQDAHDLRMQGKAVDVFIKDRKEFLEANGYEVTRENMMDITLNTKPQEDEDTEAEQ